MRLKWLLACPGRYLECQHHRVKKRGKTTSSGVSEAKQAGVRTKCLVPVPHHVSGGIPPMSILITRLKSVTLKETQIRSRNDKSGAVL